MARRADRVSSDSKADAPKRQADGRHCEECGVKLSAYNPGPNCWSHTIGHPWRGPEAKPKY
jgi:hypothetical protein